MVMLTEKTFSAVLLLLSHPCKGIRQTHWEYFTWDNQVAYVAFVFKGVLPAGTLLDNTVAWAVL